MYYYVPMYCSMNVTACESRTPVLPDVMCQLHFIIIKGRWIGNMCTV